jgi:hypothetical protein
MRMLTDYPVACVAASAEDILAEICDYHRQRGECELEADVNEAIRFETTVAQWREACELRSWRPVGRALAKWFGITCWDEAWRDVLEPAQVRTLEDVCWFIARRAMLPAIRPKTILGSECVTAGVFLTIRSQLAAAGAKADGIGPSTPLAPFTRQYVDIFLGPIARLAPGALPTVRIFQPIHDGFGCATAITMALAAAGHLFHCEYVALPAALLLIPSFIGMWISSCFRPRAVSFGELRTFGDLARVIAAGAKVAGEEKRDE